MESIKFRAWDKKRNEWYNESYDDLPTFYGVSIFSEALSIVGLRKITDLQDIEVEQYTGLKDVNKKEIYQGDIVKLRNPQTGEWTEDTAEVTFSYGYVGGWVITKDHKRFLTLGTRSNHVEVVGNIHETIHEKDV